VSNSIVEKVYVSVDENATKGVSGGRAAIAIRGGKIDSTVYPSVDNVISQCSVINLGYRNPNEEGPDTLSHYGYGIFLRPQHDVTDVTNIFSKRNKINNNYISQCKVGMQLIGAANNTISGNILINAQKGIETFVSDDWPGQTEEEKKQAYFQKCIQGRDGINATISNYNTIVGNQINKNGEHGIYLSGSKKCTIRGNVCNNNGASGIKTRYADNNIILGNVCYGQDREGYADISVVSHGSITADNIADKYYSPV